MQISSTGVFAFVEGKDSDPYFYDRICNLVCSQSHHSYRIVRAEQVGGSGGKPVLLQFFDYLRTVNSLSDVFTGKRTVAIFYLDKDLDDIFHKKIFSDHIVYTQYYGVENYLFSQGNLINAACAAASVERAVVEPLIGDEATWTCRMSELWKDWLILCLFAARCGLKIECTYRRNESNINVPPTGPVDQNLLSARKQDIKELLHLTDNEFHRALWCITRLVDRLYGRQQHDVIFKGKWYIRLLQLQLQSVAAERNFSAHALSNAIVAALRQSLQFDDPWSESLRIPLYRLLVPS